VVIPVVVSIVVVILVVTPIVFPIITLPVLVPVVVVLIPAVFSLPITLIVPSAFIAGYEPLSARIRCPSPITLVPLPMVTDRIPVTVNPNVIGTRLNGTNTFVTRRRRRSDLNTERDLSPKSRTGQKRQEK
jgi:hypothetical protein